VRQKKKHGIGARVEIIRLKRDENEEFYSVETAFIGRPGYPRRQKRKKLWERSEPSAPAAGQQALFVDTSSQSGTTLPTAQGQSTNALNPDIVDEKKLFWERSAPARSTSGVDPRLRPSSLNRPEGEPPNASSQSSSEETITTAEDEIKPKEDKSGNLLH
jgi:hypothetical protein